MPWIHGDWIADEDGSDAPASRWAFVPYVRQLFEQAGWKPLPPPAPTPGPDAMAYGAALLREFGGLTVGATGRGLEQAAGNLEFLAQPKALPPTDSWMRRWHQLREAVAVAQAFDTYVVVFVDAEGRFLAVTDVDHKLYDFGPDFARFAETMLRGLRWPAAVAPEDD